MIALTRFNHEPFVVNDDLILYVEATPDTLLTMTNGEHVHVRESVEEVVERVVEFRRRVAAGPIVPENPR